MCSCRFDDSFAMGWRHSPTRQRFRPASGPAPPVSPQTSCDCLAATARASSEAVLLAPLSPALAFEAPADLGARKRARRHRPPRRLPEQFPV